MGEVSQEISSIDTVLLSAVAENSGAGGYTPALENVGTTPFLAMQVRQLKRLGFKNFLVEVDQVSGALIAIADGLTAEGIDLEFIRDPKELSGHPEPAGRMLVVAASVYIRDDMLARILDGDGPVIATVEGSEENEVFERIDLNTRWSGVAVIDSLPADAISEIPEGWSLPSALLRQSLQSGVRQLPIAQPALEAGNLLKVTSAAEMRALAKAKFQSSVRQQRCAVGAFIFAPIAKLLVLNVATTSNWLGLMSPIFAALALLASFAGLAAIALASGLVALFILFMNKLILDFENKKDTGQIIRPLSWLLLALALAVVSWQQSHIEGIFAAAALTGLLVHSHQLPLAVERARLLPTPAFAAAVLLLLAIAGPFDLGLKALVILQILALLVTQSMAQRDATGLNRP